MPDIKEMLKLLGELDDQIGQLHALRHVPVRVPGV